MDKVFITDLVARGIIGINAWEREKPQEILINIVLFTDLHKAGISHNIHDSANYRTVAKKVLAHAETSQRQTVEALASDLARLCLEESGVEQVCVRVEKPGRYGFQDLWGLRLCDQRRI